MKKRHQLLKQIQELEFAALDLNLYLDTHPKCQEAIVDYNKVTCELEKAKTIYQMNYGPLANFGEATSGYPWTWVEEPWPWENTQC